MVEGDILDSVGKYDNNLTTSVVRICRVNSSNFVSRWNILSIQINRYFLFKSVDLLFFLFLNLVEAMMH